MRRSANVEGGFQQSRLLSVPKSSLVLSLAAASRVALAWLALTRVSGIALARIPLARGSLARVSLTRGALAALTRSIVWPAALPALARLTALTWIALATSGVALTWIVSHFALPLWVGVRPGNSCG